MPKFLSVLLLFCALTGFAQEPLLTSHWTQGYPYNQLCPRDPVNDYVYSAAGCPAIAMGQIINYLRTTQGTRFSDNDDYTHHYAGRNYNIDDDWEDLQFPSFPTLNEMLDSVDAIFARGEELPDFLAAAVVFACGTACTQVYTSQGSGTFAVDQAFAAYQRFGFTDCVLFRDPDSAMYATLIANLQAGYPAHLAVENPEGTVGHNVVVDGYRESDGKFHVNFGYGISSLDDWYSIPDPDFYYGMTKVEGIILNIIPTIMPSAVHESARPQSLEVYPNPVSETATLQYRLAEGATVSLVVTDMMGRVVSRQEIVSVSAGIHHVTLNVSDLPVGLYLCQLRTPQGTQTVKFVRE